MAQAIRATRQAVEEAWKTGEDTAAPVERRSGKCIGYGRSIALRQDGKVRAHGPQCTAVPARATRRTAAMRSRGC